MQVLSLWCSRSNLTWQGILKNLSGSNFIWVEVWSHNVSLQHARLLKKTTIPVGRTESYFSCCNDWVLLFDMFLLDMNGQQLFFEGFKGNIKNNWPSVLAHYGGLSPSEATSAPSRKMTLYIDYESSFLQPMFMFFLLVGDLKWLSLLLQLQRRKSGEEGDQWKLLVYVSLQTYACELVIEVTLTSV